MPASKASSTVLTIRVPRTLDQRLTARARRSRHSRSEAARLILEAALFGDDATDPAAEARRQSLRASQQDADLETQAFLDAVADDRGWR